MLAMKTENASVNCSRSYVNKSVQSFLSRTRHCDGSHFRSHFRINKAVERPATFRYLLSGFVAIHTLVIAGEMAHALEYITHQPSSSKNIPKTIERWRFIQVLLWDRKIGAPLNRHVRHATHFKMFKYQLL